MRTWVLATGNPGKVREVQAILQGLDVEVIPQSRFQVPGIEETGESFVENAILKARHASRYTGLPAIADDSGLEVDALEGAPGILSSRYAGPGASDWENIEKLLKALEGVPEERRSARFQCAIAFFRHGKDPMPLIAQGSWEGRILFEPRGKRGFGYDPLFLVPECGCSAAELPPEGKRLLSHRAKALKAFIHALEERLRR
ncbi:MAG: RdgB/HAM1 family non-canonical purine NTP pyrophosphatase [Gammaproteobacteria bacterium]|nr:MAG: RdgB/HAM1 family non-canonical purine NTP pyrophosphatase [Gammaproteobacteria bacterium]